ncbi:MAG: NAD(P)/FAD-dependent oxidoreductase [Lentisphaeria bacterium]|nr:NAD(P)/FAD-dependent oxidoreductase [Lentisphaeria bacterium]
MKGDYDIIVIGGGLAGLTAANRLAANGRKVLLAEQHFQIGGLAAWFKRKSHVFDVSLHGFPVGMKKSFRKYWGKEYSDRIEQVRGIRFDNPQFSLQTTFDTTDFSRIMNEHFNVPPETVKAFFDELARMNYYDDQSLTTRELFQKFFPGNKAVWRLLMEPITYANGSTLDEPAISYGIVFGNFMSQGVFTFVGGTDLLMTMMAETLRGNGVDVETSARVEKILVDKGHVKGAVINGEEIGARAVVSNGNIVSTVKELVGSEYFSDAFLSGFGENVRLSNSSSQVYMGIKPGEKLDYIGDLLFTSTYPEFDAEALCAADITSRTYSVYYPSIRPGSDQYTIVASMNAKIADWEGLDKEAYRRAKQAMIEDTLNAVETYVPNIRQITDYTEAATPRTFERYTLHKNGASFGTKFQGLKYSMDLHKEIGGLFHCGSVGIIMSGWLGTVNYGVIAANDVEKYLFDA